MAQAYFVECYWPGVSEQELTATVEKLAREADDSGPVLLESILVPADEIVISVVAGPSLEKVRAWARTAGLPADRITECVRLTCRASRLVRSGR